MRFYFLITLLLFCNLSFGYLDPGFLSIAIQSIVSVIAGLLFFGRSLLQKIKNIFIQYFKSKK